mmetsp:Transcript_25153/g.69518  ORF Transcript_25153/g.69518 Transcript_25153/m.69518 type:complete len:148 (+) Transcript_25153:78-521(+)
MLGGRQFRVSPHAHSIEGLVRDTFSLFFSVGVCRHWRIIRADACFDEMMIAPASMERTTNSIFNTFLHPVEPSYFPQTYQLSHNTSLCCAFLGFATTAKCARHQHRRIIMSLTLRVRPTLEHWGASLRSKEIRHRDSNPGLWVESPG